MLGYELPLNVQVYPLIFCLARPVIGGVFSRPAERWPDTFGKFAFLREYPFFLSCALAAVAPLLAYVLAFVGLKEVGVYVLIDTPRILD